MGSHSIIRLNLTVSIMFGCTVGLIFPFYVQLFGIAYESQLQFLLFLASCLAAGFVVGLMAFLITKLTILKLIRILTGDLKEIAEGQGDLTRKVEIESDDVIGEMAYWFNTFVARLDEMFGQTKKLAFTLRTNGIEFNINLRRSGNLLQAVFESLDNMEFLSSEQRKQVTEAQEKFQLFSQNMHNLNSQSNTLTENFKDLTHFVQKQSNLLKEFYSHADNLSRSVGDQHSSSENLDTIERDDLIGMSLQFAQQSTRSIDEQGKRFNRIDKLLEEIEDIAESTHLLSINASIEAARAGEAGRGFTIVALQIRNLATNSTSLTSEIREQIDALLSISNHTSTQLSELHKSLNNKIDLVNYNMQELNNYLEEINKTSDHINNIQRKLKDKVEDLGHNFIESSLLRDSMKKPMDELWSLTETINNHIKKIALGSDEIEKVTESFLQHGKNSENQIQTLVKNMEHYHTSIDTDDGQSSNFD